MLILNLEGHIVYLFFSHISPSMFLHGNVAKVIFFFFPVLLLDLKFHLSFLHMPIKLFAQEDCFVITVRAVISSLSFCGVDVSFCFQALSQSYTSPANPHERRKMC